MKDLGEAAAGFQIAECRTIHIVVCVFELSVEWRSCLSFHEKAGQSPLFPRACRSASRCRRWGMETLGLLRYGPLVRREGSRCAPRFKGANPALPPQL
jgi:hypothetical protein